MSFPSNYSLSFKIPSLKPEEEALFGGLDRSSKGQGRIYKKLNEQGEYSYFRASGWFSGLYHFLFSKRIEKSDVEQINARVVKWMNSTEDFSSKLRVEATFDKIFKRIQKNRVFTFLQEGEGERLLFQGAHLTLFQQVADKINAREKTPSATGQKSEVLREEEIVLCRQLLKMADLKAYPHLQQAFDKLKETTHPVHQALEALFSVKDSFTSLDMNALKEKSKNSTLTEEELRAILGAKAKMAELRNQCSSYLDLESFRSSLKGVDQIFALSEIENPQISDALSDRHAIETLLPVNPWIITCASEQLQNDTKIVQQALRYSQHLLPFAMDKAKTRASLARMLVLQYPFDQKLLTQLVQWHGSVFRYANSIFQSNKDIIKLAIKQNVLAFHSLHPHMKEDPEILQLAMQKYPHSFEVFHFAVQQDGLFLQHASEAIKKDLAIIRLAMIQNPDVLQFVDGSIRNEIMIELIAQVFREQSAIASLSISIQELILQEILKTISPDIEAKQKTTIWTLTEMIAQKYISSGYGVKAMEWRMQVAQAIMPAKPLADIHLQLANADPKLGIRISSVDTSFIKNQVLAAQKRTFVDGTSQLHLEAKLSHHTRANLQSTLDFAVAHSHQFFEALPKGFCKAVHVTEENDAYYGRIEKDGVKFAGNFSRDIHKDGYVITASKYPINTEVKVIHFEGVGKVRIGSNKDFLSAYNRISIDLDPEVSEAEAAAKLNILFAALGLGPVNSSSRESDIERIKVLQLFRAFYPQVAYTLERNPVTFEVSIEELKARIVAEVPEMETKFKYYFEEHPDFIYQQEVYPGQAVWAIKGLADEVKKKGAIGLMAGVTADDFSVAATRFASILKSGALSSQDRFQVGIIAKGESSGDDIKFGGSEAVFTRMITQKMPKKGSTYPLCGKIQILYDLALVERVGYAFPEDKFGTKFESIYDKRTNLIDLAEELEKAPDMALGNEVCIRNRISPQFIKGVMVVNQKRKNELIATLRAQGLITANKSGQEVINGIPIDQFIHIGNFKAEYWA